MKISIIVGNLSSSGAGRWNGSRVFLLAEAFQNLGYSVEILGFTFEGEPASLKQSQFTIKLEPATCYPGLLISMWRLAQKISGDIICALRPRVETLGLALLYRSIKKTPIILDVDDWELSWLGGENFRYRPTGKEFLRDLLKPHGKLRQPNFAGYLQYMEKMSMKADAVTIHTQFLQQKFGGTYVPNGKNVAHFDPSRYSPEVSRKKYGLSQYKVLMFPGAPRPYKGIEDVLAAMEQLQWFDLRLVIVGGSPYDDYDQKLQTKWGKWLIQIPPQPYEQMPEIVSAAHIIVVPQHDTPSAVAQFPLKVTDGMAMAKPIISTTIGDMPTILGDCGVLVPPQNPAAIATAIQAIFGNWELYQAKANQARQRCIDLYSIDCMSKALSSIIQKL